MGTAADWNAKDGHHGAGHQAVKEIYIPPR